MIYCLVKSGTLLNKNNLYSINVKYLTNTKMFVVNLNLNKKRRNNCEILCKYSDVINLGVLAFSLCGFY